MNPAIRLSFEEIVNQHEGRIYYYIHKLNINDPHKEFYQEGLCALWSACETYQPEKCLLDTYLNYTIRNRLVDLLRKKQREQKSDEYFYQEETKMIESGNRCNQMNLPVDKDPPMPNENLELWGQVKAQLTVNQWKWIDFYILRDLSIKEIAEQEGVTVDAVKGWARQAKRKLKNNRIRKMLLHCLHCDDIDRIIAV
ncbi:sigma-70 family RNA polymerase sigma factor [Virgibacillus sp. FSP13]